MPILFHFFSRFLSHIFDGPFSPIFISSCFHFQPPRRCRQLNRLPPTMAIADSRFAFLSDAASCRVFAFFSFLLRRHARILTWLPVFQLAFADFRFHTADVSFRRFLPRFFFFAVFAAIFFELSQMPFSPMLSGCLPFSPLFIRYFSPR
jgi:hypothetical protein